MFTGIIEEIGEVTAWERHGDSGRLTVRAPLAASDAKHGDSISVDGVCLTVVDQGSDWFTADVMAVSIAMSTLDEVFAVLQARDIRRVYVEGGPTLASAIIAAGYADEFAIYLAPALLGGPMLAVGDLGIGSMDAIRRLSIDGIEQLGDDLYIHARQKEN